ncbi:DNA binding domain-containing protein, excisionase family [Amphibacillus marinus]|uniref:DNA binding domain-containing protein, excisionase family n=1 Tax=Amphibacillus marinus TaxID=872970 RepID=A0A1H8PN73_9BACI|nr:helix-turn-helix domain-containing protein [Amphibacillus marinus]SEO43177.1 DNA binding domain-containing protein, excisionase family [Amphibacillus marinus]
MVELYSVEELANELNVTSRTIRNYLRDGKLKGSKIGGQWRFTKENLHEFVGRDQLIDTKNGLAYRFLEEEKISNTALTILDFSLQSISNLEFLVESVTSYYNDVYEGEKRVFQYHLLAPHTARFTLSGPPAYVLGLSKVICQLVDRIE